MIEEMLAYNREFVKNEGYKEYITNKYPDKKDCYLILYGYTSDSFTPGRTRH